MSDKKKIADRLNQESEAWKPEAGEMLIGTVVDVTYRDGQYGSYPIVEVDDGELVFAFHAFHTVAQREIKNRHVAVGDEIGIKFLGEQEDGDRSYYGYRFTLDKPASAAVEVPTDDPSDFAETG
jgi:hypothetical protein